LKSTFFRHLLIYISILSIGINDAKAQERIVVGTFTTAFQTAFNAEQGIEAIITKDTLKIIDLESFRVISSMPIQIPREIYQLVFDAYYLNNKLYISSRNGGQTYRWENNSFTRLDESFTHKMQLGAPSFTSDNKFYRYGGYGFWSYRNFFTFFDEPNKCWDILPAEGSTSFPAGTGDGTYVKPIGDDWYVFGGKWTKPSNPKEFEPNNELWIFHSKTKRWELLGKTSNSLLQEIVASINVENKLLLLSRTHCYEVDLQKNLLTTHKLKTSASFYCAEGPDLNFNYYFKGYYYLLSLNSATLTAQLIKEKVVYDDASYVVTEAYSKSNPYFYLLILVIVGAIGLVILGNRKSIRRTKNKIILEGNLLTFNNHTLDLEDYYVGLLELFLKTDELSTNQILDYLKNDHLHYTQNLRILHLMIAELNLKFRLLLDRKIDLIIGEKSILDKRIRIYSLNKTYFCLKNIKTT
jgi:hypothetical protein